MNFSDVLQASAVRGCPGCAEGWHRWLVVGAGPGEMCLPRQPLGED